MRRLVNSYLWTPDIMRLTGLLNEKSDLDSEKKIEEIDQECKKDTKSCKKSKIKFVIGIGRYVYWNFEPKMIIDLDWIELNSKHPINVILLEKRKRLPSNERTLLCSQ